MAKLFILAAPSGTGKTTVSNRLLTLFPNLQLSISCTTRSPRPGEINGKSYFFLSCDEFDQKKEAGDFIEFAEVHGNWYATSRTFLEESLKNGHSVLLPIDVQGARQLKDLFQKDAICCFMRPPSLETLEARLRKRATDSNAVIERRLKNAIQEMKDSEWFDHQLINDDLNRTIQVLSEILIKEGLEPRYVAS